MKTDSRFLRIGGLVAGLAVLPMCGCNSQSGTTESPAAQSGEYRTFTDAAGKSKFQARIVDADKTRVKLEKDDGETAWVPTDSLGEREQRRVRKWQELNGWEVSSTQGSSDVPQPAVAPRYQHDRRHAFVASAILPEGRETQRSAKKLQQIALAFILFQDQNRTFPRQASYDADGQPLLSWRVHLLPFLGEAPRQLYAEFHLDEPWDSEHNRALIERMPMEYKSPRDNLEVGRTCYVAPVGDNINGADTLIRAAGPQPDLHGQRGHKLVDIQDGPDKTLILVEVDPEHSVVWTQPIDLTVDPADPASHLADAGNRHFLAATVDAEVHKLPLTMTPACFLHLFLCNDGMTVEPL